MSLTGSKGKSNIVTLAVVVVAIIGVIGWRYLPASMKAGTFLKVAGQVLAQYGAEDDQELAARLKDLAIRSGLSMGPDGVEIERPEQDLVKARLRFSHPVDLFLYRTKAEYDEVIEARVVPAGGERKARMLPPAQPGRDTEPEKAGK